MRAYCSAELGSGRRRKSSDTKSGMMLPTAMFLVFSTLVTLSFAAVSAGSDLPNVTFSGHLELQKSDGSDMFYAYYESQMLVTHATPILLWLQVALLFPST